MTVILQALWSGVDEGGCVGVSVALDRAGILCGPSPAPVYVTILMAVDSTAHTTDHERLIFFAPNPV